MKTFFRLALALLLAFMVPAGCAGRNAARPKSTPVPPEGFVRQSYDIQGLLFEDGEARVYGLVLNTGTLDIAYIGFTVELCDGRGNMLYEQRYESVLYQALAPGDSFPFNCVIEDIYIEDEAAITGVRIGDFLWEP